MTKEERLRGSIRKLVNEAIEDVLYEADWDGEGIARTILGAVRSKIKTPKGFGGFEVAWYTNSKEITLLFDTPRAIRHPDEYDVSRKTEAEWDAFERNVDQFIQRLEKKYKGVEINQSGDVYGSGVKSTGRVRDSRV